VEPRFARFDDVNAFAVADGVSGRPLFGGGAMLNLIELEPGASGALALDVFRPVREDYRTRWENSPG